MSKIIIPASKKDLPKILEIINHEILTTTSIYDYEPRTLEAQKEWFAKKQKEGMPVLVMKEEEEVLGFGTYGIFRPWPAYQFSLEHSIYVHKDHRGKGVGKALMYELIERASTEGFQ